MDYLPAFGNFAALQAAKLHSDNQKDEVVEEEEGEE